MTDDKWQMREMSAALVLAFVIRQLSPLVCPAWVLENRSWNLRILWENTRGVW
jgi:hypothetical protein